MHTKAAVPLENLYRQQEHKQFMVKQRHTTYEKLACFAASVLEGFFSAGVCEEKYWFYKGERWRILT